MDDENVVLGRRIERSLNDHVRGCEVVIAEAVSAQLPSHLVGLLCDSVRLAREYCDSATRAWIPVSEHLPALGVEVTVTRRLLGGELVVSEAYRQRDGQGWDVGGQRWSDDFVLAWQRKPRAYQPAENQLGVEK